MVWRTANVLKAGNGGALPEAYGAQDGKEIAMGEQRREWKRREMKLRLMEATEAP